MDTVIGDLIATFVAAFVVMLANFYLQKKGHGKVRVFLSLIVICIITHALTFTAYVVMLTDSAVIFNISRVVIDNLAALGGAFFFIERLTERFRTD